MSQALFEEFLMRVGKQKQQQHYVKRGSAKSAFFCLMRQGGKFNRGKTAGSQSQLLPAVGHEAASVGSCAAFFKATTAWGDGSWAFASPHLPFCCQQPWPHSHFSFRTVNGVATLVKMQESSANNKRANCHSAPHHDRVQRNFSYMKQFFRKHAVLSFK